MRSLDEVLQLIVVCCCVVATYILYRLVPGCS
jgi:hypothetical protein